MRSSRFVPLALALAAAGLAAIAGACTSKSASGTGDGHDTSGASPPNCLPRCNSLLQLCPDAGVECGGACKIVGETQLECLEGAAHHACNADEARACRASSGGDAGGGCVHTLFGPCTTDADCHSNQLQCTNGGCYAKAQVPCATSDQCAAGEHCTTGCCYPSTTASPCVLGTDCASGACVNGICN